ncbi:Hpt domain-containing protein [Ferrimonas marina]|uniref:HPt (Histidine-containing phosphotransfer) domain-containing protein n=1 Tax=Ferrimonas marina TaxID=299255 RepID=A0A1M5ZFK3_9GAMM|nr:Hpt domain-containing protein [Ferrimonas marina]SHI22969.1 HPt (histidine-containing phosphotransfer) domain-containing protein [Ferrimonas marina]
MPDSAHLDVLTLDQYIAAIGAQTLMKSVVLFEQMAPDYVAAVAKGMAAGDKAVITSEAHKLKGAAGSVGLKRIQELSQKLQCGDEPQWPAEHAQWFAQIEQHMMADVESLKAYLNERS